MMKTAGTDVTRLKSKSRVASLDTLYLVKTSGHGGLRVLGVWNALCKLVFSPSILLSNPGGEPVTAHALPMGKPRLGSCLWSPLVPGGWKSHHGTLGRDVGRRRLVGTSWCEPFTPQPSPERRSLWVCVHIYPPVKRELPQF